MGRELRTLLLATTATVALALPAAAQDSDLKARIARLEALVQSQQVQIDSQAAELARRDAAPPIDEAWRDRSDAELAT